MNGIPVSSEVLGAMIAPAVLISASGVSVLFTSERLQISPELTMTESDKEA
jgi:hypothetical protein